MCKSITAASISIFLFCLLFSAMAEDSTVTFGGKAGWPSLSYVSGIGKGKGQLGFVALVLDSTVSKPAFDPRVESKNDLSLSFDSPTITDETGNYTVVSSPLIHADGRKARRGSGAAICNTSGAGLVLHGRPGTVFSSPGIVGSFAIEFWLYPAVVENGNVIFQWKSSRKGMTGSQYQYVRSSMFKNHLEWVFSNIWVTSSGKPVPVSLAGRKNLIPGQWSHHEISYDADSGIIEYTVDGSSEDIRYVTSSGHERGDVYSAMFGPAADIEIVPHYSGLIDEFRITRTPSSPVSLDQKRTVIGKYPEDGGRFETEPFDTGGNESVLKRISVLATCPPETGTAFFVRSGNNFYEWTDTSPEWIPVKPGAAIEGVTGRYFQVAGELYTDGRGMSTPAVTSVTLQYEKDSPPWPPARIFADAGNGSVTVSWPASIDYDTAGYLVYYGERPGEYLAAGSPVDAGNTRSFTVTGLKNGRLYYFSVAAYDASGPSYPGLLSGEVYARPLALAGAASANPNATSAANTR